MVTFQKLLFLPLLTSTMQEEILDIKELDAVLNGPLCDPKANLINPFCKSKLVFSL